MEVSFATKELRVVFQNPAKAFEQYGPKVARLLSVRFADLRALSNAAELEVFSPTHEVINSEPALKLDLIDGYYLILVSGYVKNVPPSLDWAMIKRIKILDMAR